MKTACINCGAEVDDTATFCLECGSRLTPLGSPSTPPTSSDATGRKWRELYGAEKGSPISVPSKSFRKKNRHILRNRIIVVVLAIVVIVALALASQSNSPQPTQTASYDVDIHYFATYTSQASIINTAAAGQEYLILTLRITDYAAAGFQVNALYFHVTIDSVTYNVDTATFSLQNYLQPVTVQQGGTVTGSIAFQVPIGTQSFQPSYEGSTPASINWIG